MGTDESPAIPPDLNYLRLLVELPQAFAEALPDYGALLRAITGGLAAATGDACSVRLLSADGQSLDIGAAEHPDPTLRDAIRAFMTGSRAPVRDGFWTPIVTERRAVRLTLDADRLPVRDPDPLAAFLREHPASALIVVPLLVRGRVLGGLSLVRFGPGAPYTAADEEFLRGIADRAALALDNADLYRRAQADLAERQRAEAELHALNEALEVRVGERTAELAATVERLRTEVAARADAEAVQRRYASLLRAQYRLLDLTRDAILVRELNGTITFWSDGAQALYGWSRAEALGRVPHELLHTAFPSSLEQLLAELERDGAWEGELEHTTRDGRRVTVLSRWALERDDDGSPRAALEINTDITARKAAEASLRASEALQAYLVRLGDALRPLGEPLAIQAAALRALGRHLGIARVGYYEADAAGEYVASLDDYSADGQPVVGRFRLDDFGAHVAATYRAGRTLVVDDVEVDAHLGATERRSYAQFGSRAFVGVPLFKDGRLVAVLGVNHDRPRSWTDEEIALIEETAERTWSAVERARAETALRANERQLRGQKEAFQAAIGGASLGAALGILARIVAVETAGEARTAFYIADPDRTSLHPIPGAGDMSEGYLRQIDGLAIGGESLACGLASATSRPVVTPDVFAEQRWLPWIHLAREYDFRACWSFPIETREGEPIGTFTMYFRAARDAAPRDYALAGVVTQAAAIIIARDIEAIKRARAEEALGASEARLRRVLETDAVGVLFFDRAGTVIDANDAFLRMSGYSRAEVDGRALSRQRLTPPEWIAESERQLAQLTATGRIGPYDQEYVFADGSRRWMRLAGRDLGDGTIVRFCIDITAHKQVQAALAEEVEALERLHGLERQTAQAADLPEALDAILDATMALHGADFGTIQLYDVDTATLRIAAQRGFDRPFLDYFAAVSAADPSAGGLALARRERVVIADVEMEPAYAPNRAVARAAGYRAVQSTPLFAPSGAPLGMISTHFRQPHHLTARELRLTDLYARHAADAIAAHLLTRSLRASEARFRGLLDAAPDAVVTVAADGRIALVNAATERLFGYAREDLLGQPVDLLLPGRYRRRHPRHRTRYFAAPRARPMGTGLALFGRRRDGTEFPVEISLSPLQSDEGPLAIAVVRDITARQAAEAELAAQADAMAVQAAELARSNRELEQFAYVASHDLQEPLRMVASYTQLLARRYRGRLDADADEFIGYAVDGAERMQRLIRDLLEYSRAGTRGGAFAPVDVAAVADAVLADLGAALAESGAAVAHEALPTVRADAGQLRQLLQNLVGNALKYRRPGVPPRVRLTAARDGRWWRLAVADNGIGIAPEHAERVFGLFQRLHTREEYAGTGIGLAICRKIVERHGGRIWAEPTPGGGATFLFTLPDADTAREVAAEASR